MKTVIALSLMLVLGAGGGNSASGEEKTDQSQVDPAVWELTFSDEFEGEQLDYEKWIPKDPWGFERNDELQGYVQKAFHLEDGILKIRCEKEASFYSGKKRDYRSGMMTTLGRFSQKYGRFEIRCRVPAGKGLWPAFWLLADKPLSWPPEIDILEILGENPRRIYFSHHWADAQNPGGDSKSMTAEVDGADFSKKFHTLTLEWEEDEMRWYIDGVEKHRSREQVPARSMFLLVNLAVGGWAEAPDSTTPFPSDFEIDYVRVWSKK